jgi:ADP-dependent phosphofructokinase/glucokinase
MSNPDGPQNELNEFLGKLAEHSRATLRARQRQVAKKVEEFIQKQPDEWMRETLQKRLKLDRFIALCHLRLIRSLSQDIPPERVLCGFNALADVVYRLEESKSEEKSILGRFKTSSSKVRSHITKLQSEGVRLTKKVDAPEQAPVAILQAMKDPAFEWKPLLEESIRDRMHQYVYNRSKSQPGRVAFRLGGASGNMDYVLCHLGLRTTGCWPYHAAELAADSPENLFRLTLNDAGHTNEEPATDYGFYYSRGKRQPDACRRSFVFEFSKGQTFCGKKASDNGRIIFIVPAFVTAEKRPWTRLIVRTLEPQEDFEIEEPLNPHNERHWPFFPVFARQYLEGNALVIEIAANHAVSEIARRFDYFMLTGIQALGNEIFGRTHDGRTLRTVVKHALQRQLDVLARGGVFIHWETGEIKNPALMDDLAEIARGRIKSAALNHTEVLAMTAAVSREDVFRQTRYAVPPARPSGPGVVSRYKSAMHLARELNLDELYVHGNDIDLIVRRRTTRGALRQEVAATLFAKGVVLLTLLRRSVPDWKGYIERQRVPPLLKPEGFIALLELAEYLSRANDELGERVFLDIIEHGYYFNRNPEDYSVMAVPVMWPELKIPFSTAGAGDTTSSVVAVYSGK